MKTNLLKQWNSIDLMAYGMLSAMLGFFVLSNLVGVTGIPNTVDAQSIFLFFIGLTIVALVIADFLEIHINLCQMEYFLALIVVMLFVLLDSALAQTGTTGSTGALANTITKITDLGPQIMQLIKWGLIGSAAFCFARAGLAFVGGDTKGAITFVIFGVVVGTLGGAMSAIIANIVSDVGGITY